MIKKFNQSHSFTLVEIMIVMLAIIIVSTLVIPNFLRAHARKQASIIVSDARQLDTAAQQWAMANNKKGADTFTGTDLSPYLKAGNPLAVAVPLDILKNPYLLRPLGDPNGCIGISTDTKKAINHVLGATNTDPMWEGY